MEPDYEDWSKLLRDLNHTILGSLTGANYETAPTIVAQSAAAVFTYAAAGLELDDWQYAQAQARFLAIVFDNLQGFFVVHAEDALIPGQVETDFQRLDNWFSDLECRVMPRRAQELLDAYGEIADEETIEHWKMLAKRRD